MELLGTKVIPRFDTDPEVRRPVPPEAAERLGVA